MSGIRFSFPACVIAGKGRIDRHDLLILRKYAFTNGIRGYDDALLLLALNDMCPVHCDDWPAYFVEQLTAFIVDTAPPRGRLDAAKAAWLIRALALDGHVENPLQLETLLHAIERADSCPDILSAFALDQLRYRLLRPTASSYGATRHAGITADDMAYIWRLLRCRIDGGHLFISSLEASSLAMIEDVVRHRDNHPGWQEVMDYAAGEEQHVDSLRSHPWLQTEGNGGAWDERVA
ncbi:hypothetical protein [Rhizobium sp.]|uniref:hypothetical protein n=1 Tax=Rhizobium sp. TaxID=391 RepID=UPI0028AA778B